MSVGRIVATLCLALGLSANLPAREWRDASGKKHEATLDRVTATGVVLDVGSGKISVATGRMSNKDRAYVKSLYPDGDGVYPLRTWTDSRGRQLELRYSGEENGMLRLQKADTSTVTIGRNMLSLDDQDYLRDLETVRRDIDSLPPVALSDEPVVTEPEYEPDYAYESEPTTSSGITYPATSAEPGRDRSNDQSYVWVARFVRFGMIVLFLAGGLFWVKRR